MYLPVILLASVVFIAFATAIISLSLSNVKMANLHNRRITSMSIAEAGINYYLWHLAHDNTDYCDGGECPPQNPDGSYGPFNHDYKDQSGSILGNYQIYVTPPTAGNSITTVKVTGQVAGSNTTRTVVSTIGMPSYTKYTLLVNDSELWVGDGEKVTGSVFVNHSGVRMDGEVTGDTYSTEQTYWSNMFDSTHPGIWGSGTFGGAKLFPVPQIDFNQLNVDMLNIRNAAKDLGEGDYYDTTNSHGYHIVLSPDGYHLYKVTSYRSNKNHAQHLSIVTETDIGPGLGIHNYPEDGIVFLEDNVWVEGTVDNDKITIIAADPEANGGQKKRIVIPNNVKYTNYDGNDKIGLITQTNILLTRNAPYNLEIDAAMIAKDGEIRIENYNQIKGNIRVYGSLAHNTGLIWTYSSGGSIISGYKTTETIIDQNNVLNPPPKFPLTGSYAILSWREE